jgi:tetratricopeptide (TPR) repeat protein
MLEEIALQGAKASRNMDERTAEAVRLMTEANRARLEDRSADAHRDYAAAVDLCRQAGARRELIRALKGLGQIERDLDRGGAALPLYEEAVAICREEYDALLLAHTVRHVGDIHQDAGQAGLAEPCYLEAITIYRNHEQTEPLDLANAIRPLAILRDDAGEVEEAKRLWAEARDLYAAANVQEGVAESSRRLALLEGMSRQH